MLFIGYNIVSLPRILQTAGLDLIASFRNSWLITFLLP